MSFTDAVSAINAAAAGMPAMPTFEVPAEFGGAASADATAGTDFGSLLTQGIEGLQGVQSRAEDLAVQAATGDLDSIQDYTIAAAEASTATQLAVTLRNQAVSAFTQIMQMQA